MLSTNRLSYLLPRCLLTTHSQPVPALSRLFSSSPPAKHTPQPSSVACLIIGDEILSGKTHDTNSFLLAKRCFNVGLDLRRIEVVPDVEDNIVSSVQDLSERHRWVFTSGGIGPTHDDITYAAIAKAFRCPLKYHTQTIERMKTIRQITLTDKSHPTPPPLEMTESRKRMALFPAGKDVKVIFPCDHLWVPIVIVQNVHILPGIPNLFKDLLDAYLDRHIVPALSRTGYTRLLIATSLLESDIAPALSSLQSRAKEEDIKIGSYPQWRPSGVDQWNVKVVVSLVGANREAVEKWGELVKKEIHGVILRDSMESKRNL